MRSGARCDPVAETADKSWAPIAYYSRPTNETENRYHSFELEMLVVVSDC